MTYSVALSPTLIRVSLLVICITFADAEISRYNQFFNNLDEHYRDKCIHAAKTHTEGNDAFEKFEEASASMVKCLENDHGSRSIREGMNNFCQRNQATECIEPFTLSWTSCLENDEQVFKKIFMSFVRSSQDYFCNKGAEEMGTFLSGKGLECLISKEDEIKECLKDDSITSLLKYVIDKACNKIEQLDACIVGELEKCDEIGLPKIFKSMFRIAKEELLCGSTSKTNQSSEREEHSGHSA